MTIFQKNLNRSDIRNKSSRSLRKTKTGLGENNVSFMQSKPIMTRQTTKLENSDFMDINFLQKTGDDMMANGHIEDPLLSVKDSKSETEETRLACIFKTNDDIRLDTLILQVMSVCKDIFENEKSWLYLRVYNTFTNALDRDNLGGLIEVMQGTQSISEMINENELSLTQCMLECFDEQNPQFLKGIRENFIHSTAAYSLLTYILQIKDRYIHVINNIKGIMITSWLTRKDMQCT